MLAPAPKRLALTAVFLLIAISTTRCGSAVGEFQYLMMPTDSTGPVCVHLEMPYSDRLCPMMLEAEYFIPAEVTAETLVVHTSDNRTIRVALPNRTDAIFLTNSAMSTFLLRHYDATNPAKARELRTYMRGAFRKVR
jgi:hypothetical protein